MRFPSRRPGYAGLLAVCAAAVSLLATASGAQEYPARSPTIIVPFAPGAGADISARIAGEFMGRALGVQFVVENVAGAGGTTGTTRSARAAPDGYTIALGHMGTHAASVALHANLAYNPTEDFIPIGLIADQPMTLVARKDFPAGSLQEFAAYARANEAKLNGAHAGIGSVSHVTCLLLHDAIGIKPTMVAFGGTGPAMNALVGGQIDYLCDTVLGAVPQIQSGNVKGLAVATPKRNPALASLPTSSEGGLPTFLSAPFYGLFVPKGTPQPIVDKLEAALDKALDDEGARKRLLDLGAVIPDKAQRGSKALHALVKSEIERLTPIIKAATASAAKK